MMIIVKVYMDMAVMTLMFCLRWSMSSLYSRMDLIGRILRFIAAHFRSLCC